MALVGGVTRLGILMRGHGILSIFIALPNIKTSLLWNFLSADTAWERFVGAGSSGWRSGRRIIAPLYWLVSTLEMGQSTPTTNVLGLVASCSASVLP